MAPLFSQDLYLIDGDGWRWARDDSVMRWKAALVFEQREQGRNVKKGNGQKQSEAMYPTRFGPLRVDLERTSENLNTRRGRRKSVRAPSALPRDVLLVLSLRASGMK